MDRILIVEDNAAFAHYLRRGLTYEGFDPQVFTEAETGLSQLRFVKPRAVILDIVLPGMDGITACRALRESGYDGPVLMLTARDGIRDRVIGLDSGADDYLPKPCEFAELLARLRSLLRRCPDPNQVGMLSVGDATLDEEHFTAWRAGQPLLLTHTEFTLLATLMRSPRQVHTRDDLLTAIWGHDFDGSDKVLDMTISRLRAKLGQPDLIHTRYGVGYSVAEPLVSS